MFAILVIGVLLAGTVFVAFFGFDLSEGERDVSWISNVEDFIVEVRPPEPIESWGMGIYGYYFTLQDKGESELLYHVMDEGNTNDSFVRYLQNILCKTNNTFNSSVDEEFAEEIFLNNRLLQVYSTSDLATFEQETTVNSAWFILKDNLNKNLKGTILIQQTRPTGEIEISLQEITK